MTILGGRFEVGQRVFVYMESVRSQVVCERGRVVKTRASDNFGIVALDKRSLNPAVHPFPADDPKGRATHVVTHPDCCDRSIA